MGHGPDRPAPAGGRIPALRRREAGGAGSLGIPGDDVLKGFASERLGRLPAEGAREGNARHGIASMYRQQPAKLAPHTKKGIRTRAGGRLGTHTFINLA